MPGTEPHNNISPRPARLLWVLGLVVGIVGGTIVAVGLSGAAPRPPITAE